MEHLCPHCLDEPSPAPMRENCKKMQLSPELCQSQLKQTDRTPLYCPLEGKRPSGLTEYLYLLLGWIMLNN